MLKKSAIEVPHELKKNQFMVEGISMINSLIVAAFVLLDSSGIAGTQKVKEYYLFRDSASTFYFSVFGQKTDLYIRCSKR